MDTFADEGTVPLPRPEQLSAADQAERAASMSRHPAGRKQLRRECPTCGQNASGALGEQTLATL